MKKKQNNKPRLFNSSFATWQDISPTLSNAVKDLCKKQTNIKALHFIIFFLKKQIIIISRRKVRLKVMPAPQGRHLQWTNVPDRELAGVCH